MKFGTNIKKKLFKILKYSGIGFLSLLLLFFLSDLLFPFKADIAYSPVIEARDGTVLYAWLAKDEQWRIKASLDEISPEFKKAIIFKEDKYFYSHPGINPVAVGRALFSNLFHLRRTSGASTITMQVVRMLHPESRTYFNKFIEMFRAGQLELHYSKDEILDMYCNLLPYGGNIQGIKTASLLYFNKTPDKLSLAEATALTVIPNRPNSLRPGKNDRELTLERNKWLTNFKNEKLFASNVISDALHEPFAGKRLHAPCQVPQFAWRLHRKNISQEKIRSTLDKTIQQNTELIVTNYIQQLKNRNINNAAVLVVNNNTHEVLAYVGSPDFHDRDNYGEVDGVQASRSPGSTLKPLLYGLCFDAGLITPKRMLEDVPLNIAGYTPENYDLNFRGKVTAEDALKNSLNIPAVELLNQLGLENFLNTLGSAGFTDTWKNRDKEGLSVILGGCSVRLDELTALYSCFANDGIYYPLKWTTDEKKNDSLIHGIPIISRASDYMLTQILSTLLRPDLPNAYESAENIPKIAWKTGTSYGRRDAWSVGYNKNYTIGVWIGNFSGKGVPDLSGASVATPLLFRLFNAIDYNAQNEWQEMPQELGFRLVCEKTGKVPNDFCMDQVMDYYIPGVSANEKCDHLKQVWISGDEKYSYCTSCLPPAGYKTKFFENISPELASFYKSRHIAFEKIPPHNPACTREFSGRAPIITSLNDGMVYIIMDRQEQQLTLSCSPSNDVSQVYWYVNDKFLSAAKPHQKIFFNPTTPLIKISCADDKGRNTNIEIKVKFV
ncbi:MAG TPA: penicillin-binding protein 1C [Chitinophagaceae bacterium]|nr:penicillin-binding protein 1C [Chitinophagaceae bacterium]